MTGSALDLALQVVVRHDELVNVKHGVLRDALVDVLRNYFPLDRAQKVGDKHVNYNPIKASPTLC